MAAESGLLLLERSKRTEFKHSETVFGLGRGRRSRRRRSVGSKPDWNFELVLYVHYIAKEACTVVTTRPLACLCQIICNSAKLL